MRHYDDESYERYKQYRISRYTYENEQIIFPIALVAIFTILIGLWKYILIALAAISVVVLVLLLVFLYLKKQAIASQQIVLTQEEAREGVDAYIHVTYNSTCVDIKFEIPPGVKDGQKFVVHNVVFENKNGRKVKKRIHFQVKIS